MRGALARPDACAGSSSRCRWRWPRSRRIAEPRPASGRAADRHRHRATGRSTRCRACSASGTSRCCCSRSWRPPAARCCRCRSCSGSSTASRRRRLEAREQALTALGAVAWRTLRESDAVFRLGDVVAVAVLVDTAEPGALMVAERVREALRTSPVGDSLTVSAGIACYPDARARRRRARGAAPGSALELARDARPRARPRRHRRRAGLTEPSARRRARRSRPAYFAAMPRRLSFIVGVSSSESGSHSSAAP